MDEFMRVLLLKMNKVTFTSFEFYDGQNFEIFLNRTFSQDVLDNLKIHGAATFKVNPNLENNIEFRA